MTDWVDEIATSSKQKTVDHLAMTDLDRNFHPHLVLQSNINVYSDSVPQSDFIFTLNSFTNNDNIMNYEETSSLCFRTYINTFLGIFSADLLYFST